MSIKKVRSKKFKSGYGYRIDVWVGAKRHRKTFESRAKADAVERRLRASAIDKKYNLQQDSRVTVAQIVSRQLERLTLRNHPQLRHHRRVLKMFQEIVGSDTRVMDLKKQDLARYVDARLKTGIKGQTANRELTRISTMLHKAGEMFESLEEWVCPKMPREKEPRRGRERVVREEDEIGPLIAALRQPPARPNVYHTKTRQDAIDYIIIALQTMMRGGELRNLKKSWINFRWRTITLPKEITKTGEPRIIEMTNTVFEILTRRIKDAQQEGETSEYIFFNRREGKSGKNGPSVDLRTVIRAACKRAGIPYGRNNPGGWSLHDLRHTATTMALESGAPIAGVQDMAGHSDRVMTLKYTHGTPASRRETVRALEEYGVRILSSDSSESVSEPPKRVTKKAGK